MITKLAVSIIEFTCLSNSPTAPTLRGKLPVYTKLVVSVLKLHRDIVERCLLRACVTPLLSVSFLRRLRIRPMTARKNLVRRDCRFRMNTLTYITNRKLSKYM